MSLLEGRKTLLLIGGGNMGGAMLRSWVHSQVNGVSFIVLEPRPSDWLINLSKKGLVELNPSKIINIIDVCVLAIKPQKLEEVLEENCKRISQKTLIISVVAGKKFGLFYEFLGKDQPIIRVMPNTPVSINQGMSVIVVGRSIDQSYIDFTKKLFNSLGKTIMLKNEKDIDAVTAISGSGPAYVFNFIENLSEIGEELGLSSEVARKLSIQTVLGASLLASSSDLDVGSLRKNVTSPGGTTEAALKVLMDGKVGWKPIIKEAILAAHVKSWKLASN